MWCQLCILVYFMNILVSPACGRNVPGNDEPIRRQQISKPRGSFLRQESESMELSGKKKKYNASWYTTSYYSESMEYATGFNFGNITTETTGPPTATEESLGNVTDDQRVGKDMSYVHPSQLTAEAWAALTPEKRHKMTAEHADVERLLVLQRNRFAIEESWGVYYPFETDDRIAFYTMCYQVGSLLYESKHDMRDYQRLRYAYYNQKEFEIGYIVQEIVHKYTVVLELFHLVQYRYYNQSIFARLAPVQFMIYTYTVILEDCQQIIHLCNVLQELNRKFEPKESEEVSEEELDRQLDEMYDYNDKIQDDIFEEQEREIKKLKAVKKKAHKEIQKLKKTGEYSSTRKPRTPKMQNELPEHYGWSIEYW